MLVCSIHGSGQALAEEKNDHDAELIQSGISVGFEQANRVCSVEFLPGQYGLKHSLNESRFHPFSNPKNGPDAFEIYGDEEDCKDEASESRSRNCPEYQHKIPCEEFRVKQPQRHEGDAGEDQNRLQADEPI